jgi:hypothetical protein
MTLIYIKKERNINKVVYRELTEFEEISCHVSLSEKYGYLYSPVRPFNWVNKQENNQRFLTENIYRNNKK